MLNLTLPDFLKLLKKWWWFITAITLLVTSCIGYISLYKLTPIYSNTSTLLINDKSEESQKQALTFNDVMVSEKLMGTYKDIIKSRLILNAVGQILEPQMTVEQLESMISITINGDSQVFRITVEHPNYALATNIANLVAETFNKKVLDLMTIDNVRILDHAELKSSPKPVKPNKKFNVSVAFVLSLFFSVNFVLLIYLLDTRIRGEEDLSGISQYPIIGVIPNFDQKNSNIFYN